MTSSVTNPGKAFARIALALAIAAMGIYVASSDPPGGAVVGFLLMLAAVLFGVRTARNRLPTWAGRTAVAVGALIAAFAAFLIHSINDRGASLRATSGRAVGQRVGTLATIGGSGRSRAADGARGHRGAEPARSLDRGRHRRRPREYRLGRRVRMEGRRHAYARHTRYSIQHRHCGTGGHRRRGRVPRPDQHRHGFGGRVEPGSYRGAGRGLPRLHGRPRPHPQADWYQRPATAIAGRSRDVLRAGNILAGLHHRSPQWTTTDVHARPGVLRG